MAGKKGDMDFKITADPMKAVQGLAKVVAKQEEVIAKLREQNRLGRQTKQGMNDIGGTADRTTGSILRWAGGLLSIGGAVQGLRSVVAEMEKAAALRAGMRETALSVEQLSLKIAHLRGDVSMGGIAAVTKDIAAISRQARVSLDVAAKAQFYSESAIPEDLAMATTSALSIAKFAAPAGLTPEDVIGVPRIFKALKAKTQEQQLHILGQIYESTTRSLAETGPFLQAFTKPMISLYQRGFTFPQSLGMMAAAVETSGEIAEAGTTATSGVAVITGRTGKAIEYLRKVGKKRGVDFSALTDIERLGFMRELFEETEKAGPRAMDEMKIKMGGKGFDYLRRLFSELGKQQYDLVTAAAEQATGDIIEQLAEQYKGLMTAEQTLQQRRKTLAEERTGRERRPDIVLRNMTKEVLEQVRANLVGGGEYTAMALTPGGFERKTTANLILSENIGLAYEFAKGEEKKNIAELYKQFSKTWFLTNKPDMIKQIYEATEGFGLMEKHGRLAEMEPLMQEVVGGDVTGVKYRRSELYTRGLKNYFGIGAEGGEQTQGTLMEIRDELREMNSKLPGGVPVAMPYED